MGDYVRKFWRFMCVVCCIAAFVLLVFFDDAPGTVTTALSGLVFFLMSEWSHEDLDAL